MPYKVPFVNYRKYYRIHEEEIKATLHRVLSHGDLILREDVTKLENSISGYLGLRYGVGTNSGTDALYLSLLAAGIGHGDEVVTVGHTFLATIAVIVHCGATPVLIDIGEDFNMNVDLLEAAITPRTRAVMPVHLNGRLCDMEKLISVASAHHLIVIEDAAQALGATFDGKKAGSFGLAAGFSFYPAKSLGAYGDAGMAVANDEEIDHRIRLYRDHGRETKEDFVLYGFNSRLDNLQAAILNMKFKYFPQWIERRREIAMMYQEGLTGIAQLKLPPPPETGSRYFDTYQNYVIQAPERDKLATFLKDAGVETLIFVPKPYHFQPALKLSQFRLPITERVAGEALSLPMYPELDNRQVEIVVDSVRKFFKR
ncbi:MAG TPA: DegT/DnrJ/EryC1/StrS family aminotransferase [Dehalococcoidales bacterium]|nr:DegT/DnrJ/EryC1/StrS family aminotransferase [Dehalococcoidales bacterium]